MTIVVDRHELGPIGTNCYVVRSDRATSEAVVVDPSGSATELRLELARSGAACAAILVTHGHWDHLIGVADLAEGTGAKVHMAADEAFMVARATEFSPPGIRVPEFVPDVLLDGDETLELAGISFETLRVPGHSPGHLAFHADGHLFSAGNRSTSVRIDSTSASQSPSGRSVRPTEPAKRTSPEKPSSVPGTAPRPRWGRKSRRIPFLAPLRAP